VTDSLDLLPDALPFHIRFFDDDGKETFRWRGFAQDRKSAISHAIESFSVIWQAIHHGLRLQTPDVPSFLLCNPQTYLEDRGFDFGFMLRGGIISEINLGELRDRRPYLDNIDDLLEEFLNNAAVFSGHSSGIFPYRIHVELQDGNDDQGQPYLCMDLYLGACSNVSPLGVDVLYAVGANAAACSILFEDSFDEIEVDLPTSATRRAAARAKSLRRPAKIMRYLHASCQKGLLARFESDVKSAV